MKIQIQFSLKDNIILKNINTFGKILKIKIFLLNLLKVFISKWQTKNRFFLKLKKIFKKVTKKELRLKENLSKDKAKKFNKQKKLMKELMKAIL